MTPKRAAELVRACQVEYDYQFKNFVKAQAALEEAEQELAAARARLVALTGTATRDDTSGFSPT